MLREFKEFAMRGNVLDLAIGVIIGAAFGGIVASLVDDIIMPIIGAITGGLDFSNYFVPLSHNVNAGALAEAKRQGAVFAYGSFLTKLVNFIIIAWVLFLVVKAINRFKRQQENAPRPSSPSPRPSSPRSATSCAPARPDPAAAFSPSVDRPSPNAYLGLHQTRISLHGRSPAHHPARSVC